VKTITQNGCSSRFVLEEKKETLMQRLLKQVVVASSVSDSVEFARRVPDCIRRLWGGATGFAPPPIKRRIVASYMRRYSLSTFVETGTHVGNTLAFVARGGSTKCISIELSDECFFAANLRFRSWPSVRLLHGDSALAMPEVLNELRGPGSFWLDGHYSGGATARGGVETPISAELQVILASSICGHVILIDDARCFDGSHDYPHLDELLRQVRVDGRFAVEVSADIIRLTPTRSVALSDEERWRRSSKGSVIVVFRLRPPF
jgi:hypothetical protein